MNKSEFLGLNLPSRDNTTDIADINAISDNFEIIDGAFLDLVEKQIPEFQTKENINLNFDDDSNNEEQYPSVPAVVNFTNRKVDPLKIINSASGNTIVLKDSAKDKLNGLKLFGKTTQDGTPTPDSPIPLVSVGDSGSFTVKIQGENDEEQTLTLPYTLRSVMNLPEEIDFTKGTRTNRYHSITINSMSGIIVNTVGGATRFDIWGTPKAFAYWYGMCNRLTVTGTPAGTNATDNCICSHTSGAVFFRCDELANATDRETWLAEHPIHFIYRLAEPIETPLTEQELNAYRQLHTNKPNTTILSEADMEVDYVADTKLYIDNKLAELTALTLEV